MNDKVALEPRRIDHLVLPTRDLSAARDRLGALGFNVAPTGRHPFGTVNCCVYLGGGTFLEPLAVGDEALVAAALDIGNVFVTRDRNFRDLLGNEGISAIVAATDDAAADHLGYQEHGVSAGDMLDFSRPFADASGRSDTASFRLAFCAVPEVPDAFFFSCQRVNVPEVDRAELELHANGVSRLSRVVAVAGDAKPLATVLGVLFDAEPVDDGRETLVGTANGDVVVVTAAAFERRYGAAAPDGQTVCAVDFDVASLPALEKTLDEGGIGYHRRDDMIAVPPAPGQGALFSFREKP